IHVPMVDVRTVGAGGGSIARVTPAGLLQIGPESAGAVPGPIAYGRGGREPTITDANSLLGRMGGRLADRETRQAIAAIFEEVLARPLGLSVEEAAAAVIRVANTVMAGAIRMVSISLGHDPRDFALFAFGGAGPLHACALAAELGIPRVLIPARPGITNALGCVVADLRHDFVTTLNRPLPALDAADLHAVLEAQEAEGRRLLARERVAIEEVRVLRSLDMQFAGQTHLLRVPLGDPRASVEDLAALFAEAYDARFRVRLPEMRPVLVNANTSVIGRRPTLSLAGLVDPAARAGTIDAAELERRPVFLDGAWVETPVFARERLPLGARLTGPAILSQMDTTLLLEPCWHLAEDADGNLLLSRA
ncbi:MAG: hydantoinase/oxoprolinase family protein, partial [Pseudomonadota bacterium]